MSFSTQLTADDLAIYNTDEFAETVTYNSGSISAIVDYGEALDEVTGRMVATAQMSIKVSDVASPARRDVVVINSVTWYVSDTISGNGSDWDLLLFRDERMIFKEEKIYEGR